MNRSSVDCCRCLKMRAARQSCLRALLAAALVVATCGRGVGGDWPQLLGPDRNGQAAPDERLADRWPVTGPGVVWRRSVGSGYAGVAVAAGKLLLFHRLPAAEAGAATDMEMVEAIDAATGKTLWRNGHPTRFRPQVGGGDGPLCVPVIHDGRVVTY